MIMMALHFVAIWWNGKKAELFLLVTDWIKTSNLQHIFHSCVFNIPILNVSVLIHKIGPSQIQLQVK